LAAVNVALLNAGLDKRFSDLLFLRVSQINGCAYCVDEHARDLRHATRRTSVSMASPASAKVSISPIPRKHEARSLE